jgi:hypothetical protein
MSISIKQLTINTKVNKQDKKQAKAQKSHAKGLSKMDKEAMIQECLARVKELIDYELRP